MNKFDLKLQQARTSQYRFYALFAGGLATVSLILLSLLVFSSGTLVKVLPKDAKDIAKVRVIDGFGTAIKNVVYGLTDHTQIVVSAKGFKDAIKTLSAKEKGGSVVVILQEMPGHLIATTTPIYETIRWKINGQRAMIAATIDRKVPSGLYDLELNSPYYKIENRSIRITRAEKKEVLIPLKLVEGHLNISSIPSGSIVMLDDAEVGKTPVSLNIRGGKYQLKINHGGYKETTEVLEVTNSKRNIIRNYRLLRPTANLAFKLKPPGGTLLVNGQMIDQTRPYKVKVNVNNTISYSLNGYYPKTRTVRLKVVESKTIILDLKPEIGEVNIRSTPYATVLVNNIVVGRTPITLNLIAKTHSIQLREPGYRTIKKNIVASSNHTTILRENLWIERIAQLSESPRSYKNSIDMDFLRFEPTEYTMGAPRHEKGQRANEFVRKIKLTKAFYAGKHEVTNSQYKKFKNTHSIKDGGRLPVTSLSWFEAITFCNWVSNQEKLSPFYNVTNGKVRSVNATANGYRLLSEAEWEWLARRASRPVETIFPWGNESIIPPMAGNIADETARGLVKFYIPKYTDKFPKLAEVGSFPAEPSGLFDLTGNASEWVHDFYTLKPPLSNKVDVDPLGPRFGGAHVLKGASWRSGTRTTLRAAYRDGLADRRDDVGFRIARYL